MNSIKAECYRLIQIVVVKQFPICRVPGCGRASVTGHHLFPRNRMGTAFNPKAVFAVCVAHHDLFHSAPVVYREIARRCLGDEYEVMRELSLMVVQYREQDFRLIKAALNNLLTALAGG